MRCCAWCDVVRTRVAVAIMSSGGVACEVIEVRVAAHGSVRLRLPMLELPVGNRALCLGRGCHVLGLGAGFER